MVEVSFEEFLIRWFSGPSNISKDRYRELGYLEGPMKHPSTEGKFRREVCSLEGLLLIFNKELRGKFKNLNLFLSIASYVDMDLNEPIYDRLVYDFDSGEDPKTAITTALEFSKSIKSKYGCEPIIVLSGLKGAHVVIPLSKPTNYEGYQLIWDYFYNTIIPKDVKPLVDVGMKDWNRLDRVPYTWNIKYDGKNDKILRGYSKIVDINLKDIDMKSFDWGNYESLDISQIEIYNVVPSIVKPKIVIPKRGDKSSEPKLPEDPIQLIDSELVPPCIRNLIDTLVKAGDLDHNQRIALVLYLKWVGFSVDDVVDLFRKYVKDFKENITKYQVEFLYGLRGSKKDYLMYSCGKLKALNICVGCGWGRNPVTYTYARASIPEEIKGRFFSKVRGGAKTL